MPPTPHVPAGTPEGQQQAEAVHGEWLDEPAVEEVVEAGAADKDGDTGAHAGR